MRQGGRSRSGASVSRCIRPSPLPSSIAPVTSSPGCGRDSDRVDILDKWYGSVTLGLVITAAAMAIARLATTRQAAVLVRRVESVLQARAMAAATGVTTALVVWWCWGSIRQVGFAHDERAYLLQASIFAARHWTAQSPPLPQFFEQMHVLIAPSVAAKYPPGHSLILAVGAWLGLPGLVPLVLSAIAGALVFVVSRRIAGPWVAVLTWFLWVTDRDNLVNRATYFSETTTSALWLFGWWALLEWRRQHSWWAMTCLGACVGWGAITRPLTMLVFAVPAAAVVLVDVYQRRAWRDIAPGLLACAACLAIIPVWSAHTIGDWRVTPLAQYTREYIPWDHLGLGYDSTPPERALPSDLQSLANVYIDVHKAYSASAVAPALAARTHALGRDFLAGWRRVLAVFLMVGLLDLTAEVAVGLTTAGLLILAYLSYAHPPDWTLYYLELLPLPAFLAARGVWTCVNRVVKERAGLAVILLLIAGAFFSVAGLRAARNMRIGRMSYAERFTREMDGLDTGKVLIFVRYGPHHIAHHSLVGNVPDLATAHAWVAYDQGAENRRLMALAPERSAYLYDEQTQTFAPFPDSAVATPSRPAP
jgi:hypothetical protein